MEMYKQHTILFVVTSLEAGGLENYLVNILSTNNFSSFKSIIVYTKTSDNFFSSKLEKIDVETCHCSATYLGIDFCLKLLKLIKAKKVDIVCDFRNDFSFPSLIAGWLSGVKYRIAMYRSSRHGFEMTFFKKVSVKIMHFLTYVFATKIICNTKTVLNSFYPHMGGTSLKFSVVNNGIDLDRFMEYENAQKSQVRKSLKIDEDKVVIGHVGRFHVAKNHKTIVNTFKELSEKNKNVHLLLVGDGCLRREIEQLVEGLGIEDRVTFAGLREDIPAMLNAMDIFFYPSIYEGLPNALIEAMACGLPIVASNIPEIIEITPRELQLYFSESKDITAFLKTFSLLILDGKLREELIKTGKACIEKNYTIQKSASNLISEFLS